MARKSPRIAESVIKAESQTTKVECDAEFINLKVKQQVLFFHIWISIYIYIYIIACRMVPSCTSGSKGRD
jgi:hypothetical protein